MIESFDGCTASADFVTKWNSLSSGSGAVSGNNASASNGRFGTAYWNDAGSTGAVVFDAQQTWIIGCAVNVSTGPIAGQIIFMLYDGASAQLELKYVTGGFLRVTRNGTTLGTTTAAFQLSTYYYIEFKAKIDDSVGTYEVRVDGTVVLTGTGADTKNTANATADTVKFGGAQGFARFDDLYICDGSGVAQNDFLGEVRVQLLNPTAEGSNSDWTPNAGTHFSRVSDTAPDSDTTYIASGTVGHIDTVNCANSSLTGSPIAVQTSFYAKKDDAGARTVAKVIRSGTTNYVGATRTMGSSYGYFTELNLTDPDTGIAWTLAGVNAAEIGVKVIA